MITPGEQQPDTTLTETKPDSSLPAAPGELEQKVKEQKWQQSSDEVDKIVDRLGKGIDTGIKETVVALKVMDIGATQSCEGHLDWGTRAPWVEIGASDVREMEDRLIFFREVNNKMLIT